MRHGLGYRKLNKTGEHRKALFKNMLNSLIKYEQIITTLPKAKELKPQIDKVITIGKKNDLSNKKGTIAMARTSDPHSATSQFFINLKDNDFLDKKNAPDGWGYCVFGEVTQGLDIVEAIGSVDTGNKAGHGDVPIETIIIENVEVLDN